MTGTKVAFWIQKLGSKFSSGGENSAFSGVVLSRCPGTLGSRVYKLNTFYLVFCFPSTIHNNMDTQL